MTKKLRRKLRSKKAHDMRPHVFDKIQILLPYVLLGFVKENEDE